ncbi:MAG: hypothetical protein IJ223_01475 [Clostridia bacterium]|nr:hypothetical protein [Clostridia bacterium]
MLKFVENPYFRGCKDVILKKDNKELNIFYGGNLDIYFEMTDTENFESETIEYIVKNEEKTWIYFNRLISEIINSNDIDSKNELVKNNTINWYSDETYKEAANILSIKKEKEGIRLVFHKNSDYESYSLGIPIRIRNVGSRYKPFNMSFMKLYNEFQELAKKEEEKIMEEER